MRYFWLYFFMYVQSIFCQNPYIIHYTTANSPLPSNNIKEVLTDTNDNIWMTTGNGLVKYSAGNWEIFNTSNSGVPYNNLNYFYIDNHNNLWFAANSSTFGAYYKKFDGTNWINSDTSGEYAGHPFAVDDAGGKWGIRSAGMQNANLAYVYNDSTTIYTQNDLDIRIYNTFQLFVDKLNRFWIISGNFMPPTGISYFSNNQWHTAHYSNLYVQAAGLDIDYKRGLVWHSQQIDNYPIFTIYDYDDLNTTKRYNTRPEWGYYFLNDVRLDSTGKKIFYLEAYYSGSFRYLRSYTAGADSDRTLLTYPEFNPDVKENLEIDRYMNKYIASVNGLYIVNEEGIIYKKSIARNRNLYFDSTLVDSIRQKPIWLFNPFDSVLSVDSIEFTSSDFYIDNFSSVQLAPMDSIELIVSFRPTQSGVYFEGLNIYDNYSMHTINLKGKSFGVSGILNGQDEINSIVLYQNYPNPFNPVTNITYAIPQSTFVTLKVYDVLGNEIKTLVNEEKSAGGYNLDFDGSSLASGIYFYVLRAGDFIKSRKMLLLK